MAEKYHHGNSPAAWTAVVIVFVGVAIGSAFTVQAQPLGVLAGAVVALLGGVVGLLMRAMGLGQQEVPDPRHEEAAEPAGSAEPVVAVARAAEDEAGPEPRQAAVGG
ncbi:HGxxPAAW family protein [Streptomyces hoynatensis]|uniref:HGxxPAAW family protein n=1 Tax=Streptomyces hoynatensis TaxID=1141874 RepID=UPI001F4E6BF3|nr:HGxxPAAW family protein [Streptomyces hoynatensis]